MWRLGKYLSSLTKPELEELKDQLNLTDDEEEYNNTCCKVDTKELRLLIDVWCNEVKKFKEKNR